jgi:FAD/FMN-containing dehydrogenase
LHTRPIIDTEQTSEINLLEDLAKQVFKKVISYRGTITGEHGDGLARSRYVQQVYGIKLYSLFKQLKRIFDPHLIMNPGKKVIFTADDNITHKV